MVTYTGIVGPPRVTTAPDERFDVIVSTGGGATDGHRDLAAAIEAKPLTSLANARWLALSGPYLDTTWNDSLVAAAASNDVTLRPFVDDLAQLLAYAQVSISQAGYNTVADLLRTGCRAVLCPYAGIRQNEQTTRAFRLRERGLATMVADAEISPRAIADAIECALAASLPRTALDLDGAAATARILRQLMQQRA
jgi:predicted glycosyltransferase